MKPRWTLVAAALVLAVAVFGALPAGRVLAGSCISVTSGDWSTAGTWGTGCTGSSGVPGAGDNVAIAHTVTLTANASVTTGTVTVNSGGVLNLVSYTLTANTLTINDNGEVKQGGSGTAPAGTITTRNYSSNSTYTFEGTQNGLSGTHPIYGNLKFIPTPSTDDTFALSLDVRGNFTIGLVGAKEIRFATGATGRTHRIDGDLLIQSGTAVGSNGSSADGSATINLGGSLTISGGTFRGTNDKGNATLNIKGNITNGGTWQQDDGSSTGILTVVLSGTTGGQTIGGTNTISFERLEVNNANGAALNRSVDLTDILTLTSGRLTLGSNTLTLGSGATIGGSPGASNMVVATGSGFLKKTSGGTLSSFTFPVGDASGNYTPVTLDCGTSIESGKYVQVKLTASQHGSMKGADYIKRYWTMESDDTAVSCTGIFQYVQGDVAAGATESNITPVKYSNSVWSQLSSPSTDTVAKTLTGSFTSFSDFSGGNWGTLAVDLASFTADATPAGVTLAWETVSETDNAGFNVYRAEGGSVGPTGVLREDRPQQEGAWVRLNAALIPAAAPGSSEGHAYTWTDATARPNTPYRYRLEAVTLDGATEVVDVIDVTDRPLQRHWLPLLARAR